MGPPSSRTLVSSRRPSSASAPATRAAGSPSQTITSAPAALSASVRSAGAAGPAITTSGATPIESTSREPNGSRASESNTTRVGCRASATSRAVSSGSSASAVPTPTQTASESARQRWASRRLASPEIHFEAPARVATRPSRLRADFSDHQGRPVRACLRKAWLSSRAAAASGPSASVDLHSLVAQDPGAAAARLLARVLGRDHHPRDPRLEDRAHARGLATMVGAGLERHVHGRAGGVRAALAAVVDRRDLGVGTAQLGVKALADRLAVADQHRAHERVGADPAAAALGELERPLELEPVLRCDHHGHRRLTGQSMVPALRCATDERRRQGRGEAVRALRRHAVGGDRVRGRPHVRLLLARLAQPRPDRLRGGGRALVLGLRPDLGALPAGRAAPLADDRRASGPRPADRLGAAGGGDDPARTGRRLRRRGAGASRADPGRPPVRQRDPLLDPGHGGARLRRQLLRARLPGGQPSVRALRRPSADGVHRPDVVRPGGRRGDRQRADGRGARDHRRADPEPRGGPARLRGQGGAKPGGRGAADARDPGGVHARAAAAASPPRCS